jgi:hypothetical protein
VQRPPPPLLVPQGSPHSLHVAWLLPLLLIACGSTQNPPPANPVNLDGGATAPDAGANLDDGGARYQVASSDGELIDAARGRVVPWRVYAPVGLNSAAPVIAVSHGGNASLNGQRQLEHLGQEYAAAGFVSIHVGHRPSTTLARHLVDRPQDVSFILDAASQGRLVLPPGFTGQLDTAAVGHAGHSYGAYTAHAVAGAVFTHGTFPDRRVVAIAPISPQGPDQFGSFDRGPVDNTWAEIDVPTYSLVGEAEKDSAAGAGPSMPDWRLFPFLRMRHADRFLSVIPGQTHAQMGGAASAEVNAFVAQNTRRFFEVYVRGQSGACEVGTFALLPQIDQRRGAGARRTKLSDCP